MDPVKFAAWSFGEKKPCGVSGCAGARQAEEGLKPFSHGICLLLSPQYRSAVAD